MKKHLGRAILVLATLSLGAVSAWAQDEDEDDVYPVDESVEAERCISLTRIRSTEILNERNILFVMRGKQVYRNVLPRRCPGLRRNQTFSYRASQGRLCDNDLITIVDNPGFGQIPGPSCAIGKFYPITDDESDALREEMKKVEELGIEEPA